MSQQYWNGYGYGYAAPQQAGMGGAAAAAAWPPAQAYYYPPTMSQQTNPYAAPPMAMGNYSVAPYNYPASPYATAASPYANRAGGAMESDNFELRAGGAMEGADDFEFRAGGDDDAASVRAAGSKKKSLPPALQEWRDKVMAFWEQHKHTHGISYKDAMQIVAGKKKLPKRRHPKMRAQRPRRSR